MKQKYRSIVLSFIYTSLLVFFMLIIFIVAVTEWKLPSEILVKGELEISGIVLALATIVLVIVTAILSIATKNLVAATEALVLSAKNQTEWDKRRATAEEWNRLRVNLRFPNLKRQIDEIIRVEIPTYDPSIDREDGEKALKDLPAHVRQTIDDRILGEGRKMRDHLRELEYFAADLNRGDLDLSTFLKRSHRLFLQQYEHASPYIDMRRRQRPNTYVEIFKLYTIVRGEG